jgi:predicted kinase
MPNLRFIILSGLPGSGKSTYAAQLAQEIEAEIVCPDTLRKEVTGSESDMSRDGYIWGSLVEERIKLIVLIHGKSVIFDATQINQKSRKSITYIAKQLKNIDLECHYFEPDVKVAKFQNLKRDRKVPENIIDNFAMRWETPSLDEGFTVLKKLN